MKDIFRKEAHFLKQLQGIAAWRGSLVDTVIEEKIAPLLRSHLLPSKNDVLKFTSDLIERQIEFGTGKMYREEGVSKNAAGDKYCAFYDIEYNGCLNEKAIEEIEMFVE